MIHTEENEGEKIGERGERGERRKRVAAGSVSVQATRREESLESV